MQRFNICFWPGAAVPRDELCAMMYRSPTCVLWHALLLHMQMWSVIRTKAPSPRTHFIVNVDPCAGHGKCNGIESVRALYLLGSENMCLN